MYNGTIGTTETKEKRNPEYDYYCLFQSCINKDNFKL